MDDDVDETWTCVDVDTTMINEDDSDNDNSSTVVVSRVSSPLSIQFQEVRAVSPPPIQVSWPVSLPWFQFQNVYIKDPTKMMFLLKECNIKAIAKGENTAYVAMVGSRNFELNTSNAAGITRAAAEIGKSMPQSVAGEHSATMEILAGGGETLEAKLEVFRLLAYQLSNNLIEGVEDGEGEEIESKFERIVRMFREVNLPRKLWVKVFSEEHDRTTAAFVEGLFEAAIVTSSLDIAEALLKVGADPDQPIQGGMMGTVERPIQYTVDTGARCVEMAGLLVKAGADVDGVTEDNEASALHITAKRGTLKMAKLLVENGADIRRWVPPQYCNDPVSGFTPLTFAAGRSKHMDRTSHDEIAEPADEGVAIVTAESEGLRILRYLLSLHDCRKDRDILQDALTVAAHQGRADMVELLLAAGARVNEENSSGFTALQTAVWQNYSTLKIASMFLKLGADPNCGSKLSALHMAAAKCDSRFVELLVDNGANINSHITLVPEEDGPILGLHFRDRRQTDLNKIIAHLHTPLQLALHKLPKTLCPPTKSDTGAMILLNAGANFIGGELVQAVDFNNETLVQAILDRGIDINEKSWKGCTALQVCLDSGYGNLAAYLLRNGARLQGGELFSAFKTGQQGLVNVLLANGASLQDTGPNGESILEASCLGQKWQQMFWSIKHGPTRYDSAALCAAVCNFKAGSSITPIRNLLRQRKFGKVDRLFEGTAVGCAAYRASWPVLSCLLDLEELNTCIVPLRGYYGYTNLILHYHYLLGQNYKNQFWHDSSMIRCSALVPAIMRGNWEIVQSLLDARYRPDGLSLLVAIEKCTELEISKLISNGADVNARVHRDLDTPLQLASRRKRVELVRLFLDHGADVNALAAIGVPTLDHWGEGPNELPPRSALQAAVEHGHLELIEMLLAAGADVNGQLSPDAGATALQLAAAKGYLGIAKQLLERGAQIDAARAGTKGRTALEAAAEHGRLDMVQFLLENGAKTEGDGAWQYHRAIGFASRNGHLTIARLLEDWRDWTPNDYERGSFDDLLDDEFEDRYYDRMLRDDDSDLDTGGEEDFYWRS
ncbi:hypothetical protein PAAG_02431 [Paracoccidioides lutzii Pb01]|uniref:Uncharacterized protein n=1 Tax=Paracoccidioides lutzii (strain ATCC MYA-826 / Pb01) TaxID=502779 RepID=C1GUV8_PARBA|nr:hypothetical protein PAAG_02431 [Paracoccidioides lutzii Pb01]EEH40376.1 hypothetical protein PAAG_02431 [Paracoccidioides lutzii Pb01]